MSPEIRPLDWRRYRQIPYNEDDREVLEADLVNNGYDEHMVKQFLGGNTALAKPLLAKLAPRVDKNRKGRYQELCLYNSEEPKAKTWVLFDPFAPTVDQVLQQVAKPDLPLVIKLAFYKPENDHYLENNTKSKAIRMRSAGKFLKGQHVKYTQNGPVLIMQENRSISPQIIVKTEVMESETNSE